MSASFRTESLRRLWNAWNIRGLMVLSLSTQLILALGAPLRRKISNFVVISIIWSAYFLADWIAIFVFGLISNAGCTKSPSFLEAEDDILALWASFLLVHLGGPDTITAFSLEDNALWLRHLVGLIAQVFTFLYIFAKTLPDNKLMAPTIVVFSMGVIKYGERTRSLYLASIGSFKMSSIKSSKQGDGVNLESAGPDEEDNSEEIKRRAVYFCKIFKGMIVNIMPNHSQWLESRVFFLNLDADFAFKIIAIELNLLYENFYTKIMAADSSLGVLIRNITYFMSVAALVLFCVNEKDGLQDVDIRITYALLAGVIALDTSNEVMLTISSWRKETNLGKLALGRCFFPFPIPFLIYVMALCLLYSCCCGFIVERLWSNKMGSFNLLVCIFEEHRQRGGFVLGRCCRAIFSCVSKMIGVSGEIVKMRYTSKIILDDGIWKHNFDILRGRASGAYEPNQTRKIYEARGELALGDSSDELKRYVTEFEYDQSVLFWHIATEICYNTDRHLNKDEKHVKFSKSLSDYLIYLLVKQPDMTSTVADVFHRRYQDACRELKSLERRVRAGTLEEFCFKVLEEYGEGMEHVNADANAGASVLTESCILVRILAQTERKWEILCGVWVELLSYAAGHCKADSHARLLSEGGEFITFVWLLMAHLGIGPRFPRSGWLNA